MSDVEKKTLKCATGLIWTSAKNSLPLPHCFCLQSATPDVGQKVEYETLRNVTKNDPEESTTIENQNYFLTYIF